MRIVEDFPHEVVSEEVRVPLPDGITLAGRVWRPADSDAEPVPAVLEFIPYRQRDLTAVRDSMHHPYFAGHGIAGVRVDLRGSGDSDGVLTGEYLEQELRDAEEVLAWLAGRPWCSGRTGMMGISWGGFNALQVAARRPPGLGAIVTASSTDDRYADDVHYMGGCLLTDNLSWASTMFAYNSCPPDPEVVGDRWRDMWLDRLRGSGLWLEDWLRHQRRDEFWEHGSVCEDFSAIECPVLAVSGWADGYSNSVFRLLEGLEAPRRGLVGPWSHKYPHLGQPGPAVGFLQEVVAWWDHWLRDADNGAMDGPMLRIWMQDSVPPSTAYVERPGRWVGEASWPSPRIDLARYPLGANRLLEAGAAPSPPAELTVSSPLSVGQYAGKWCSYNAPPDLPYDQREEDGGSLVFDGEPLVGRREILGSPVVELEITVDRPVAMLAARLSDVDPDGRATRISYGLLNLTHRGSHEEPEVLLPGERCRVAVQLNAMAQSLAPGHRLRLALSTSYWPLAWPPPEPVRLTVHPEHSRLVLPLRPDGPDEQQVPAFGEPEAAAPLATTLLEAGRERWAVTRDLIGYESALEVVKDLGVVRFDGIGLEVTRRADERYGWTADDVDSVRGETTWTMGFRRGDWRVETVGRTVLTSTPTDFHLYAQLDAYEGAERVFAHSWRETVPRDHV
ncbi:CocE/NonD family hydrolase [Pseudonocardia sp. RS010]|uniref:CocE/NonD family hydrolase n=1 Tax=Pseudonocardia sp. RS010 TaxID=3385979 RepID=UPI0039A2E277